MAASGRSPISADKDRAVENRVAELPSTLDVQLGEDLAEMPLNRSWTQVELGGDFRISPPLGSQPRDVRLLRREFVARLVTAFADGLSRSEELAPSAVRECLGTHRLECLQRRAQLDAGVDTPILTSQPLAAEECCARVIDGDIGSAEMVERPQIQLLGGWPIIQKRERASLDSARPVRRTVTRPFGQAFEPSSAPLRSPLRTAASISSGSTRGAKPSTSSS